jgi:hypothetical protein
MAALRVVSLAALIAFALSGLALAQEPVDWYTDSGSGGVLAQPPADSKAGGALAPSTASGETELPESDISATPPVASASDAEPVLGAPNDEPVEVADEPAPPEAAQEAPTVTSGQRQEEDSGPVAGLPLTGLGLVALAGAGVCLLIAGLALRPRRAA